MKRATFAIILSTAMIVMAACGNSTSNVADYSGKEEKKETVETAKDAEAMDEDTADNITTTELTETDETINEDLNSGSGIYEDTEGVEYTGYDGPVFRFHALQHFVGEDARNQLEVIGMDKGTYDNDLEAVGGTLVIIQYEIEMLRDCSREDIWSVLGEYYKKGSESSGIAGEAYTLQYDESSTLYKGDRITAYEIGILNGDYDEFYSLIYGEDPFFIHHMLEE